MAFYEHYFSSKVLFIRQIHSKFKYALEFNGY